MSRGGVNDNTDLRKTVGYADFSNLAPTLTEAVGNEPLETTSKTLSGGINELKKSVSDGKAKVANAITAQGVSTATDASFQIMADNIATLAGNLTSGTTDAYNRGYSQGVTDADNRTNTNSANYIAGYNAGVSTGKYTDIRLTNNWVSNRASNYTDNSTTHTCSSSITLGAGNYLVVGVNSSVNDCLSVWGGINVNGTLLGSGSVSGRPIYFYNVKVTTPTVVTFTSYCRGTNGYGTPCSMVCALGIN